MGYKTTMAIAAASPEMTKSSAGKGLALQKLDSL